eukprot:TRINITY_DN607_c1_g1_i1.p1 TRINITY_DN607_c1_g1~~TRINITY_DN607_c1_g1_i1.p1  ORF type:complete len:234 (-),score=42.79 TRINITY_DN607_c1_g1_i1:83-784(-)
MSHAPPFAADVGLSSYHYTSTSHPRPEPRQQAGGLHTLNRIATEALQTLNEKALRAVRSFAPASDLAARSALAWTCAVAVACGLFPVPGTTTALCTLAAALSRLPRCTPLHFPALQLINYAITPLQIALIYPFLRIGALLAGHPISLAAASENTEISPDSQAADSVSDFPPWLAPIVPYIHALGSGALLAVVGWAVTFAVLLPILYAVFSRVLVPHPTPSTLKAEGMAKPKGR